MNVRAKMFVKKSDIKATIALKNIIKRYLRLEAYYSLQMKSLKKK